MPRWQNSNFVSSVNESKLHSGRRAFWRVKAHNSMCYKKYKDTILRQEKLQVPHSVRRLLLANHPEVDQEMTEFMQFVRSQRLPVSRSLLQERARMAATRHNVLTFKASNGCIEKFLLRNPVQKSILLHCKGGACIPMYHTVRMQEIRATVGAYPLHMVYNMDETGLFYRMGPKSFILVSIRRSSISTWNLITETQGTSNTSILCQLRRFACTSSTLHWKKH